MNCLSSNGFLPFQFTFKWKMCTDWGTGIAWRRAEMTFDLGFGVDCGLKEENRLFRIYFWRITGFWVDSIPCRIVSKRGHWNRQSGGRFESDSFLDQSFSNFVERESKGLLVSSRRESPLMLQHMPKTSWLLKRDSCSKKRTAGDSFLQSDFMAEIYQKFWSKTFH